MKLNHWLLRLSDASEGWGWGVQGRGVTLGVRSSTGQAGSRNVIGVGLGSNVHEGRRDGAGDRDATLIQRAWCHARAL